MVSRGKPIHGVDEQLFTATERVLARTGPNGLTSRAITDEAGCAKGVLHNHYGDLQGFLAEYVITRTAQLAEQARELVHRAGAGTVLDNPADATVALFGPPALTISRLVMSRPDVGTVLYRERSAEPVLYEIRLGFTAYLNAELRLGRIAPTTDTATLAFTVFACAHQLFLATTDGPIGRDRIEQIIRALLSGPTTN